MSQERTKCSVMANITLFIMLSVLPFTRCIQTLVLSVLLLLHCIISLGDVLAEAVENRI